MEHDELRGSEARLIDIGRGGALLIADSLPPLRQAIWLRLVEPAPTDEVRAVVVRHGASNRVGISFPEPCPYDLHLAATLGTYPADANASSCEAVTRFRPPRLER